MVIHQRLELRRPVRKILNLIQEKEGWLARMSRFVESLTEDPVLVPPGDGEHGCLQAAERWDLVKLYSQDAPSLNALLLLQMLDCLLLHGRLADLPGASQDNGWRKAGLDLT
jgi:hypothetical protein